MTSPTSLPSLLWNALDGLRQAYEREGVGRPAIPPLDLWANLLRAIDESGVDGSELPAILRLSKRAVRTRQSTAIRHGWIEELKRSRGRATLRLTAQGSTVAVRSSEVETSAERAWCWQVGAPRAERLRTTLKSFVAALPLEYPHYPARYGAADATITGRNGVDWKAVPRTSRDSVSNLPLSVLISQALVAFAMGYEQRSPVALSVSISVIRSVPPEGIPLERLGRSIDVSALLRHGFLRAGLDRGQDLIYLTPRGLSTSDAHDARIQEVEAEWSDRFGAESIAALRSALEEVMTMASP